MRIGARDKARVELVLEAMLPAGTAGLPGWSTVDRTAFWRCLDEDTAPTFAPGLRVMLAVLGWWPTLDRRWRRTFWRLSPEERQAVLEALDARTDLVSRQLVATFKILACFAYFDAPHVRARFGAAP